MAVVVGVALAALAVVALLVLTSQPAGTDRPAAGSSPAASGPVSTATPDVGERQPLEEAVHIAAGQKGRWANDPPSSGQHWSAPGVAPVAWGHADRVIAPEAWVHNLEHGGVVVLFSCPDGCEADRDGIRRFVETAPKEPTFGEVKLIDTQYAVPGHRFAVMAWGWRLFLDAWDPARALAFYQAHVDRGPEVLP